MKFKHKNKIIIIVNLIVLTILFTHFNILLEYPKNNERLFDKDIELKWKGNYNSYILYIDEDEEFKSPTIKKITGNFYEINDLDFGTYYWKIETEKLCSATWKFIIDSKVAINMIEKDDKIKIENVGNTDLDLELRSLTGLTVIDLPYQESKEFEKENITFVGKQKWD